MDAKRIPYTDTAYHIRHLSPYTNYHLHLRAFYTGDIFTEGRATMRTKSIASQVEIVDVGANSAKVTWSDVPGRVENYVPQYVP